MGFRYWVAVVALLAAAAIGARAEAEPRIALVIGNAHYQGSFIPPLKNPGSDARLMTKVLRKLGFAVILVQDADQAQMKRAINAFSEKLAEAGHNATGLFFYSGHGLSVHGTSYLIPLGAEIEREGDADIEAVSLSRVIEQMAFADAGTSIVIVDASRSNPLSRGFRSSVAGLAAIEGWWPGMFIAYSTAPGSLSEEGDEHSPYVTALAETLPMPGLTIHEVFDLTRKKVIAATELRQVPWESASMTDPFYFLPQN